LIWGIELREETIRFLACPFCGSRLVFDGIRANNRFVRGLFRCANSHVYQVKEEIGLLKDPKFSAKEFEWKVDVADGKRYDEIRKQYDSYLGSDQKIAVQRMLERLIELVVSSCTASDNVVLDVATGMGTFILSLTEKSPRDMLVVGTDVDEKPLRGTMGKAKYAEFYHKMSLVVTDAKRLCVKSNSLSTISSNFGFDNIPQTTVALKESARALRPEGKAVFSSLWLKENSESMRIAEEHGVSEIADEARLRKSLQKAGLIVDFVEEIYSGIWSYNPMDLLPVEGDQYSYVVVQARKPKH
jgi:ubiquinone/menaquinone biosynthesis C-methylase UbiE